MSYSFRFLRNIETFRYNPVHELVKRTLVAGQIGNGEFSLSQMSADNHSLHISVLSVHFEWLLDT